MLILSISCYFIACHNYFILYRYLLDGWSLVSKNQWSILLFSFRLPYFLRLGRKLNIPVARLPKRLGSILKAVATGERNMVKKLTELVLADARDELIEYDPGFLIVNRHDSRETVKNRVNKIYSLPPSMTLNCSFRNS